MIDQVVDDLELAGGAVVAREAAKQRFDEVVDKADEDAGASAGSRLSISSRHPSPRISSRAASSRRVTSSS